MTLRALPPHMETQMELLHEGGAFGLHCINAKGFLDFLGNAT